MKNHKGRIRQLLVKKKKTTTLWYAQRNQNRKNHFQAERQGKFSKWLSVWTERSLVAQTVKRLLPAMQETWVQSLGQEDSLEKEMATHSSILAWRIQWTEEPGRLQSMGSQRVGHDWATSLHFTLRTVKIFTQKGTENCIPDRSII